MKFLKLAEGVSGHFSKISAEVWEKSIFNWFVPFMMKKFMIFYFRK